MSRLRRRKALALIVLLTLFLVPLFVHGDPTGATINSNTTDNGPTRTPSGRNDSGGTITTVLLDTLQQNTRWKAYVGNVTGILTLDNTNNDTIYQWPSVSTASGEVLAMRANSPDFSTVSCADAATVDAEHTAVGMAGTESDSIRNTFNSTDHTVTTVADTALSGCNMTSLWVSDAAEAQTSAAAFQEFLMEDNSNNLAYVSILNDNTVGYDGSTYDFQLLVADINGSVATTYYFYLELN